MKKLLYVFVFVLFLGFFSQPVHAQTTNSIQTIDDLIEDVQCGGPGKKCCDLNLLNATDVQDGILSKYLDPNDNDCKLPIDVGLIDFCGENIARPILKGTLFIFGPMIRSLDEIEDREGNFRCLRGYPNYDEQGACSCEAQDGNSLPLCARYLDVNNPAEKKELDSCLKCANDNGYWTSLGCFYTDKEDFIVKNIFGTLLSLAGFVALLCIIFSTIKIQISQGDSEKIQSARESLIACVGGILLIIFSVLIMRIIGVDLLGLPFLG